MATVWTTISGGLTLSDSDHIATSTSGIQGAIAGPVKLVAGGGKWYLEFQVEFATDTCVLAIADARYTTAAVGPPVAETYLFVNNGFTACFGTTATNGAVTTAQVDFAVDLSVTPNRFYHRINNGAWQFAGNPAAGTGGMTPGGGGPPQTHLKPVVYLGATGRDCTINCGDRPFVNTPPVGFSAWDSVSPDGNAVGTTQTVTASLIAGSASIDGVIPGAVLTVTVSFVDGGTGASILGATLTTTVSLIAGETKTQAIDGTPIYETTFGVAVINRYQEADYDSMFSKGRRLQSGLITAGDYGWTLGSGSGVSAFDNNLGAAAGNGPAWGGPYGGTLWFHAIVPLDIQGFRLIGTEDIAAESTGIWEFKGAFGVGNAAPESFAEEFDAFVAQQGPDVTSSGMSFTEFLMTPRSPVLYEYWEMTYVAGTRSGARFCNEIELKISHSNLDGGDRRSTNGRPEKRCVFTMSTDWAYSTASLIINPQDALFDGRHFYDNAGDSSKVGHQAAIGRAVGVPIGNPLSVVGAWLQFVFPRPVIMQRLMFVTFNTDGEVYDSGDEPTMFGRWHWEISKNEGTTWAQVGSSWSFCEGADMVAPRDLSPFDIDRSDAGTGADGVSHWRMVLEEGPAFGFSEILDQIVFDLYDATGLAPLYTVDFTDDVDGEPVVFIPGAAGSEYEVAFSDGSDDKLTFVFENTPNPVLTVHFDDGATFDTWSDLYPSVVVQTILVTTGR